MSDGFKQLERLNAQMDVWIDEEKYSKVEDVCAIESSWKDHLNKAFKHETCTSNKDELWFSILPNGNALPIKSVRVDGDHIPVINGWSFFFWAKLIRAKIQAKGTDCYYRRLDELIAYLERHLPTIGHDSNSTKLAVLYLLEMSAAGLEADQRSFAERARRVLIEYLNEAKDFKKFYDLWARYNIGVGYFHETQYQKAVWEFSKIIRDLKSVCSTPKAPSPENDFGKFCEYRSGKNLIYLPAILYRADIQLKLQLAYHAIKTLDDYPKEFEHYKAAKASLIRAEAYQQMGRSTKSWDELKSTYQFAWESIDLGKPGDYREFTVEPECQKANLKGRLMGLLSYEHLNHLKKKAPMEESFVNQIRKLNKFFQNYKASVVFQKTNRTGYLEQIAEYLNWLSENVNNDSQFLLEDIYQQNREGLLPIEIKPGTDELSCPCKEKGIDLRRLGVEHYQDFYKNLVALSIGDLQ